ncbi:hypothetical protein [Aestuariirhabdus sp. LZHN29]|uniref:hypothetical protein n=1 Tax=Aestuariirhabdus sp. LZHN29 TaxID=3417462 RepID=UPI003CE988F2
MNRYLLMAIAALLLAGCAQIAEQNKAFPLTVNTQLVGNRISVTVNSGEKGIIKVAQVRVIDDIRRVVVDKPLDGRGQLTFRVPSLATQLEIIVTDADGDKGKAILMGDDLRENEGCNRVIC